MKISATSALVLNWSDLNLYHGTHTRRYIDSLDLSEGDELVKSFDAEQRFMHTFVVSGRKRFMWREAGRFLEECTRDGTSGQVVILAAGIAPFSADLAERFPQCLIWDVDMFLMHWKAQMFGGAIRNLHFVESDLAQIDVWTGALMAQGFDPARPTMFVMEGIVYYLPTEILAAIFRWAAAHRVTIVGDFALPPPTVTDAHRKFVERVFTVIRAELNLPPINFYTRDDLAAILASAGVAHTAFTDMREIQRERTGSAHPFEEENSSWLTLWKSEM